MYSPLISCTTNTQCTILVVKFSCRRDFHAIRPISVAQREWMASGQTKGEVEDQIGRKERVERRKRWRERGDNKSRERVKKKQNIKSRKIHVECN